MAGSKGIKVAIVIGNPKPRSRTRKVAEALGGALFRDAAQKALIVDLADYREDVLAWPSEKMDAVNAAVAACDVVIVASPTYKATYAGLLKAFLDRYPQDGLTGVVTIPLLTGADDNHAMGPNVNLAPLLTELGAVVPGRGFYFVISSIDRLDEIVAETAAQYAANFAGLAAVAGAVTARPAKAETP